MSDKQILGNDGGVNLTPRVVKDHGMTTTCKLPFDVKLRNNISAGLTRKNEEVKTMLPMIMKRLLNRIVKDEEINKVQFFRYDDTWTIPIEKDLFVEMKASCFERNIIWQDAVRGEIVLYAQELYQDGFTNFPPPIPRSAQTTNNE